jgi:hypothetical protein
MFRLRTPIPRRSSGVGLRRLIEAGWNKNVVVVNADMRRALLYLPFMITSPAV